MVTQPCPDGVYSADDGLAVGVDTRRMPGAKSFSARAGLRAEEIVRLDLENFRRLSKRIFVLKREELGGRTWV
jgi:hypothetical protein